MVQAWHLAAYLREGLSSRRSAAGDHDRQQPCQSPSLRIGCKRGEWQQAVGISRGGRTTKIHCLADGCGKPVAFALTPGNIVDLAMAIPLLTYAGMSRIRPKRLLADKAYDANALR